jgi:hypothetical protein
MSKAILSFILIDATDWIVCSERAMLPCLPVSLPTSPEPNFKLALNPPSFSVTSTVSLSGWSMMPRHVQPRGLIASASDAINPRFHRQFAYYSPMGAERAPASGMKLAGQICCSCKISIDPCPWRGGERYCDRCAQARVPKQKVYMHFMLRDGWRCQFLEADLKTPLPRRLTFQDSAKVIQMAEMGGAFKMLEDRPDLDIGIKIGRGSVWLHLTLEQYAKLRRHKG